MDVRIDGRRVPHRTVSVRQLGFGQSVAGRTLLPVEILLTTSELERAFAAVFDRFVRDARRDDLEYGDDSTSIAPLRTAGYPGFAEARRTGRALLEVMLRDHLSLELLNALFIDSEITSCTHGLNAVTEVTIGSRNAVVMASGYEITPSHDRG